ncbi:MAG: CCA tRNA nucleotidyltransferase [Gemmatimonadaceae bacterium]
MRPPETVIDIVRRLRNAGFETWCVGGAVRDAILGIPNQDWDIATAAVPTVVQKMFRKVIPLGIEFGTVGVKDQHGVVHEVTTFRRDVRHDGRHAVVEFGASFVEDLRRRDFTINAIAYDPIDENLFDPFDGRADLKAGVVRAVGTPIDRFVEDRLRVLRGIRFAARFGFRIEPVTWQAMVASGPHLGRLSAERVKQELDKTLEQARKPSEAFLLWQQCGAFESLIPRLANVNRAVLCAVDLQPRPSAVMSAPRYMVRRQLRLTTLFSGRPASEAVTSLKKLRASKAETAYVGALIERWHKLESEMARVLCDDVLPADAVLRRWAADIERLRVRDFMRLAWARWASERALGTRTHAPTARAVHDVYRRLLHIAWNDAIEIADLAIDGDDLQTAGIPAGPFFGKILLALLGIVVDNPLANSRDFLLLEARRLYDTWSDRGTASPGTKP